MKLSGHLFKSRIHGIAEPVRGRTQGGSPGRVPPRVAAAVTSAIRPPTFYAVLAAPGAVFKDLHFVRRWMIFQVPAIIRHLGQSVGLNLMERMRQRHVAVAMMMPIAFAI